MPVITAQVDVGWQTTPQGKPLLVELDAIDPINFSSLGIVASPDTQRENLQTLQWLIAGMG